MSTQLDKHTEVQVAKRHDALIRAIEFDLQGSVGHAGGLLTGFSVKISEQDVLLTLRALMPVGPQIAFVGSDTLSSVFCRAVSDAQIDKLRWRDDEWAK